MPLYCYYKPMIFYHRARAKALRDENKALRDKLNDN